MNKEDFKIWLDLNDQVFALARARLKIKDIIKIVKIDGKIVVYYIPNNAKSYIPDVRVFTIEEFVGE